MQVIPSPARRGSYSRMVYVGSGDNNVYAIDAATGTQKWAFTTGCGVYSSPAVADGVVYVGDWPGWDVLGNLYALDAAIGSQKWAFWTHPRLSSSPAVADGVVYVGSDDGNVYAIGNVILVALPGYANPPTDPDGDGFYEDTNGNGVADYNDAVVLFWNVEWVSENEPVGAFDFNGNGIMDYDDAVTLFWEI